MRSDRWAVPVERRLRVAWVMTGLLCPGPLALRGRAALDLTGHWTGHAALAIFAVAYALVIAQESLHLRKSKRVMVAAGAIWALVALAYADHGRSEVATLAIRHNLLEFGELMLFLLVVMTYVNTLEERRVCAPGSAPAGEVAPVHRLGRWYGAHGAGPRVLHVLFPPQMDLAIALGYAAGIWTHLSLNAALL